MYTSQNTKSSEECTALYNIMTNVNALEQDENEMRRREAESTRRHQISNLYHQHVIDAFEEIV